MVRPALQRARPLSQRLPGGSESRHRRQVPGTGRAGRLLRDGELERGGHPAGARVPVLAQSAQRGDLAGSLPRLSRRKPRLLDVRCRSVEQMRLVNALCRFVEQAE
jgi:hypothetical protein